MRRSVPLLLLLLVACRNEPLPLAKDVVVYPGATNVRSRGEGDAQHVRYDVRAPYPAKDVLIHIADQLALDGWQPTRNDFFNREDDSHYVLGWREGETTPGRNRPSRYLCGWYAQWVHPNGRMVNYTLSYESPSKAFTNRDQLRVEVFRLTIADAEKMALLAHPSPLKELDLLPRYTPPNVSTRKWFEFTSAR